MGAVTLQVVAATCPLVVVPRGRRTRLARPQLPVIVALDGETAPEPALKLAREAACRSTDCATRPADERLGTRCGRRRDQTSEKSLEMGRLDHADVAVSTVIAWRS